MRLRLLLGLLGLIILAGIGLAARNFMRADVSYEALPVATAQRGAVAISITESGTLQALQSVTLASEINGNNAKVVKIIPEGTYVQTGDLVIEFDRTPFEENLRKLQLDIEQNEASIREAGENLKLQRVKNENDLKEARINITAAEAELKNMIEGEGVLKLRELEMQEQRDKASYEEMQQNVEDMQDMLKAGFITQNELKKAEAQLQEAESKYTFSKQKREIFITYTNPTDIEKAKRKVQESKEKYQQLQEVAVFLNSLQEANLQKEQAKLKGLQEDYQSALKELSKTSIYAPIPGLVIYEEIPTGSGPRKIQVGDAVWSQQAIVSLPDIAHMLVETQVREIDIHKVRLEQDVVVRVDAYPDTIFHGAVHLVGSLAKSDRDLPAGVKYFQIQVLLNESDDRLRPGMTARIEILVDRLENVVYLPLEAVFEKDARKICYVVQGKGFAERTIQVGKFNDDAIVIDDGIREGERVYLQDPTTLLVR